MAGSPSIQRRRNQGIEGINVTPMVDIMLVLLVIYIVASELGQGRVQVELPSAQGSSSTSNKAPISLVLRKDGQLFWGSEALHRAELKQRLEALPAASKATLLLSADRESSHGQVMQLMGLLRSSGVQDLHFATQEP